MGDKNIETPQVGNLLSSTLLWCCLFFNLPLFANWKFFNLGVLGCSNYCFKGVPHLFFILWHNRVSFSGFFLVHASSKAPSLKVLLLDMTWQQKC